MGDRYRPLLTIFQGTDNEWVAWTPEGYYTASLNGDKYVRWHINRGENRSALYYPASRFSKQFYSPKIVAKYLETGGNIKEAIRLVNLERPRQKKIKETIISNIGNILPPSVFFQIPAKRDVTVQQNSIRVRAVAKTVNNEPITDHKATQDDILDGLDWILKESTQKDLSVIFVAGHGLKDDRGNYYFLPHDGDPDKLRRTGVRWVEFQNVLSSLPSKVIFLVDSCHSGSATGKRRGVDDITDTLRELVNAESGVVVMTASTGKESSQERPEWGHGAFTKALIEGLEGKADYD